MPWLIPGKHLNLENETEFIRFPILNLRKACLHCLRKAYLIRARLHALIRGMLACLALRKACLSCLRKAYLIRARLDKISRT